MIGKLRLSAVAIASAALLAACGSKSGTGGARSESSALGSDVCALVPEYGTADLACPDGQLISQVVFASYGTPSGSCGSFAVSSSCDASTTMSIVSDACVGQNACSVDANNGVFGDPCEGTSKALAVQVSCAAPGSSSGADAGASPDAGTSSGTDAGTSSGTDSGTPPPPPPPPASSNVYLGEYPGNGPCVYPNIEQCVTWFEQEVGKKTAVVHAFSDFDNGWDDWFTRVIDLGHTMMITINPQGTIPDILNGVYDADLQRWGAQAYANTGGAPIFFRYMHEMNLPDNPAGWMATTYGADLYIQAFQHVHDQLIKGGGTNILHVWAPNVFWGDADASNPIWFQPYYPGDAYADWVGLDGYPMSESDTFANQYGPSVDLLSSMTTHPIMVAEYGVTEMDPVGTWKANWFNDFFNVQLPARPQIQAVFYQDGTDGGTDHRLDTSPQAVAAYAADIAAPRYVSSYP